MSHAEYSNLHPTKPCQSRDGIFDPERQMEKIKEERKEARKKMRRYLKKPTGKNREAYLEECIDTLTAMVTHLNGHGFTPEEIDREIRKVNLKNQNRGYWEE